MIDWETFKEFLVEFGWIKGTFSVFFLIAHAWIYRLYSGRLRDRQLEIDRIAEENREYRERFLSLLDQRLGTKLPKGKKDGSEQQKKLKGE